MFFSTSGKYFVSVARRAARTRSVLENGKSILCHWSHKNSLKNPRNLRTGSGFARTNLALVLWTRSRGDAHGGEIDISDFFALNVVSHFSFKLQKYFLSSPTSHLPGVQRPTDCLWSGSEAWARFKLSWTPTADCSGSDPGRSRRKSKSSQSRTSTNDESRDSKFELDLTKDPLWFVSRSWLKRPGWKPTQGKADPCQGKVKLEVTACAKDKPGFEQLQNQNQKSHNSTKSISYIIILSCIILKILISTAGYSKLAFAIFSKQIKKI